MTRDPVVNRFGRPWRDRLSFWVAIIAIGIACLAAVGSGLAVDRSSDASKKDALEAKARTAQLQDVICGVYVPIGNSPLPATVSPLGKTIVAATRHGAISIHCPGIK